MYCKLQYKTPLDNLNIRLNLAIFERFNLKFRLNLVGVKVKVSKIQKFIPISTYKKSIPLDELKTRNLST